MLKVRYLTKFKKDTQRLQKQHKDMDKLKAVIDLLVQDIPLPEIYRDHPLHNSGKAFVTATSSQTGFSSIKNLRTRLHWFLPEAAAIVSLGSKRYICQINQTQKRQSY